MELFIYKDDNFRKHQWLPKGAVSIDYFTSREKKTDLERF